jgi:hypothetical protein
MRCRNDSGSVLDFQIAINKYRNSGIESDSSITANTYSIR